MTDTDTATVIRDLSARLAVLEDRQAIVDLMTSYGPAIDSGCEEAVARVWTEDGVYDVDTGIMRGHAEITAMVRGQNHQGFITNGCAHVLEPGNVIVDGDTAVATCKSLLILARPDKSVFTVLRATANRWELVKTADGEWKCTRRTSRVLDGRDEAPRVLAEGVPGPDGTLEHGAGAGTVGRA
ncbi:nuclear transport factor 2 family protein [Tomitella cavernea]|uniref:Nuclear transport factor 2 family protein n=1 Tax=Tomitella cavernea TaxID=1387982 RepID=A0ABP9CSG8_9ACTN|nr:nuclear transport factor 2 family protein [Tomitella cavernea]